MRGATEAKLAHMSFIQAYCLHQDKTSILTMKIPAAIEHEVAVLFHRHESIGHVPTALFSRFMGTAMTKA
jgi:hypothetical protein